MADLDVVGVGLATLDVLVRLRDMPTWERGARLDALAFEGGGPVATALVAAARLGASVGYVGTAGSDDIGTLKVRGLVREGVDASRLVVRPGPEEQVVLVLVHQGTGERVFNSAARGTDARLRPDELDRGYITSARYLHLDGFHTDAGIQAAKWMREAGGTVVVDAAKSRGTVRPEVAELVRHVDVLIGGSGFVPALVGVSDVWKAGREALRLGPKVVVQTEGLDGSFTVTADEEFQTPAFPVDVVDTTGAGDVYHGAYIVGLLRGWDLRRTALFASAVAALKCRQLGGRAGIPSREQALAFLAERRPEITF